MKTKATSTKLSPAARKLLEQLKRRDLDYATVELATYEELRDAGYAKVMFGATGNWVFATSTGKAA